MLTRTPSRSRSLRNGLLGALCVAALAACGSSNGSGSDVASLGTDEAPAATGPGGGGDSGATDDTTDESTADSVDPADAFNAYTQCMRDEGIDLPDAQVVSGDGTASQGGVIALPAGDASATVDGEQGDLPDFDSDEYEAANDVCQPILDDAMGEIEIDPEVQAEQREQMLAHAECMREHGIDFPDPVFSDNGSVTMTVGDEDGEPMLDSEAEELQAAFEECSELMDGGMVISATPVEG